MCKYEYFQYSATAQLLLDPINDRILAMNEEAFLLTGVKEGELEGKTASEMFLASLPYLISFTQELMHKGKAWSDNLLLSTKTDIERIEVNGKHIEKHNKSVLYLSLQRISEVDQFREESDAQENYRSGIGSWNRTARIFQEFERKNELLLDAAGEGIYGVDVHGITTFANPAAQKILGYSASELEGVNMHNLVHHSHLDGSHFGVDDCPIFAAFRDDKVQTVENDIFWNRSGEPIDVEYTSTPIKDNGVIVGTVVLFRDVSEKKENERKLRMALEQVERLTQRLEMEKDYLKEEISSEFNHHKIVGNSPPLQHLLQQIDLVAPTDATVLIAGESGTGKELVARAIHENSDRSDRPLIRVNCAAIPEDLFESEFFGHKKGSFTGATDDRPGRFELADRGTLFLDEVGEIPLHLQSKLLRVLQEQQYERIGDTQTRKTDVRIIAATNRNLKEQVELGGFREDLYFRLNVFPVESVPLRKRKQDIPTLTKHFLRKASARFNKTNLKLPMSEMEKLCNYHWPGNIRELENVVERQVILAKGGVIRFQGLLPDPELKKETTAPNQESQGIMTDDQLKKIERNNILEALKQSKGKVSGTFGAAELLKINPRTLTSRIMKYKIDPQQFR